MAISSRHLRHLDLAGDGGADEGADREHQDDQQQGDRDRETLGLSGRQLEVDDGRDQRQRHADHSGHVAHAVVCFDNPASEPMSRTPATR